MVFPRVTEYDDIVQVGAGEVVQDLVHHTLKGCRSPSEAEWHAGEVKQAERCSKCCFLLIVFGYGDLPIPFRQVKCGDERSSAYSVDEIIHSWHWVWVHRGEIVQFPTVHTEAQG